MMKRTLFAMVAVVGVITLSSSTAQTPAPPEEFLKLLKDVQIQETQITENQGKIETKLNDIAENIRVARILGARSD